MSRGENLATGLAHIWCSCGITFHFLIKIAMHSLLPTLHSLFQKVTALKRRFVHNFVCW